MDPGSALTYFGMILGGIAAGLGGSEAVRRRRRNGAGGREDRIVEAIRHLEATAVGEGAATRTLLARTGSELAVSHEILSGKIDRLLDRAGPA